MVYHAMNSKSIEALKGLDFLGQYAGILVHDHETALYHFGTDHVECNLGGKYCLIAKVNSSAEVNSTVT